MLLLQLGDPGFQVSYRTVQIKVLGVTETWTWDLE